MVLEDCTKISAKILHVAPPSPEMKMFYAAIVYVFLKITCFAKC